MFFLFHISPCITYIMDTVALLIGTYNIHTCNKKQEKYIYQYFSIETIAFSEAVIMILFSIWSLTSELHSYLNFLCSVLIYKVKIWCRSESTVLLG